MDNKTKYIKLCEEEKSIPLFSKYWWMDAVCSKENWEVILIEDNEKPIASLPYFFKRHSNGMEIRKAPLTQNNGIWIKYPHDMKYEKALAYEKKLMNRVIDAIENLDITRYQQYFHYSVENWLPFYWRGYSQTTRYTYVIEDTSDLELVKRNFNYNVRKNLARANKKVIIKEGMDIEDFFNLNEKTFTRQNLDIPYSLDLLKSLDFQCAKRNSRKIYYAVDNKSNIHCAIYLVWDENSVYYLMSGSDPDFRDSQALTLLMYKGIELASHLNKKFDFEGSMKENIENFFRQFGAVQKPYHNIYKDFNKF